MILLGVGNVVGHVCLRLPLREGEARQKGGRGDSGVISQVSRQTVNVTDEHWTLEHKDGTQQPRGGHAG